MDPNMKKLVRRLHELRDESRKRKEAYELIRPEKAANMDIMWEIGKQSAYLDVINEITEIIQPE